ncbi:MAG: aquaporin [Candidatus Bathyarchaeia archaeon]|jgi:MIP family channel proteins
MGRQAYVAEFIGTFALVFFGSMSVIMFFPALGFSSPQSSFIGIALAYGLILITMFYTIGYISGCHLNPAITITAVALKKMEAGDGVAYLLAQIFGAILAGAFDGLIQPGNGSLIKFGLPVPQPAIGGSELVAVFVELIITFFLMFSYYAVLYTDKVPPAASGLLIGMTLAVGILIAGPLTGGAANPARWLGPAVASMDFDGFWVYWLGPIVGALLGGFAYQYLLIPRKRKK